MGGRGGGSGRARGGGGGGSSSPALSGTLTDIGFGTIEGQRSDGATAVIGDIGDNEQVNMWSYGVSGGWQYKSYTADGVPDKVKIFTSKAESMKALKNFLKGIDI